jgi:hypothetical protein
VSARVAVTMRPEGPTLDIEDERGEQQLALDLETALDLSASAFCAALVCTGAQADDLSKRWIALVEQKANGMAAARVAQRRRGVS